MIGKSQSVKRQKHLMLTQTLAALFFFHQNNPKLRTHVKLWGDLHHALSLDIVPIDPFIKRSRKLVS